MAAVTFRPNSLGSLVPMQATLRSIARRSPFA
jgi:hypothetical protein